jgi:formate hydrogenlyase subunit 3/multisubunit Na+/H+ antiporter MnhD subunit
VTGSFQLMGSQLNETSRFRLLGIMLAAWENLLNFLSDYWLPDAMAAPRQSRLSALQWSRRAYILLPGACQLRAACPDCGWGLMAILTICTASSCISAKDIKRLLAYSRCSSYIFLAIAGVWLIDRFVELLLISSTTPLPSLFFLVAGALSYNRTGCSLQGDYQNAVGGTCLLLRSGCDRNTTI